MTTIYTMNNKVLKNSANDKWLKKYVDPYNPNPLNLPPNTIRVKYNSGTSPYRGTTQTLVDSTNNIWDVYIHDNNWGSIFNGDDDLLEVLGANTTNVTETRQIFEHCRSLTSVQLFDTSNVTRMNGMFYECQSLTSIPLFNTTNVNDMSNMFQNCWLVEGGALALYQQASTQANPPSYHSNAFTNCGRHTQIGRAELNQIPSSWGGLGA